MKLEALIERYRVTLQERSNRMLLALDHYEHALPALLEESKLPHPRVTPRAGTSSLQDLSSVTWRQEVPAKRTTGDTTVIVRVELTVSLMGFHCVVRDPRSETSPLRYETTEPTYTLPRKFVELARQLATDPALPLTQWDATIYTL